MKKKIVVGSVIAFMCLSPVIGNADPWKDESGNQRGNKGHHKQKHRRGQEVIYVERAGPEIIYVERPAPEVVYLYDARPRPEVVYVYGDGSRHDAAAVRAKVGIESGTCNRDAIGAILGGVVGGVVGSQVGRNNGNEGLGMVVGAIAGVLLGNQIGKEMDDSDRQCTVQALEHAKDGQTITWRNPENGLDYAMTPVETYQKNNQECRRYVANIATGTQKEEIRREACKQPDGHWEVSDVNAARS